MKNIEKNEKYNSDITKEDLNALGDRVQNVRSDGADDAQLNQREKDVDFAGKNLDVPGRDLPKTSTNSKIKDEENQLYSQGSETNINLEDNTKN